MGIALADKLTYLGVVIERAAHFQCDFHAKKVKFFRCLNAVLAKIASAREISLTLKIVSANCFPILMYGIEACRPSKKKLSSLSYAYNAVFSKLFNTFNAEIIRSTQFYSGFLSYACAVELRTLNFYYDLWMDLSSPAGFLMRFLGEGEYLELLGKYGVSPGSPPPTYRPAIWERFREISE